MSAANGFSIGEGQGKFILGVAPVDIDAGAQTSDAWDMSGYTHASVIISLGVTGAASTVTVKENQDASGTGATAIGFSYYAEETAGGDTTGARTTVSASGFATSTNDNVYYVIEVDAAELSDGYNWITIHMSDPGSATFASIGALLSGPRFAEVQAPTAES
jgi:hypothetical protein